MLEYVALLIGLDAKLVAPSGNGLVHLTTKASTIGESPKPGGAYLSVPMPGVVAN